MNFIKKIADKDFDEYVHMQFQKFSRGNFKDRAQIRVKMSQTPAGAKYTILTTAEFANECVRDVAEKIKDKRVNVTGIVVSTSDLKGKLDFKNISQFQGVKKYSIDKEMTGNEILSLLREFPKAFFALSFKTPDNNTELKIKAKMPKSGKPGKSTSDAGGTKPNFCKLVTTDEKLGKDFVFEVSDFKEANVNHSFVISDIIIPEQLKKEKDFAKAREMAKRKGKIIRNAIIDGKEIKSEFEFEA